MDRITPKVSKKNLEIKCNPWNPLATANSIDLEYQDYSDKNCSMQILYIN
jgi:hypothetical protein